MSNGRDSRYKKVFALIEIIAATVFCIAEIAGCVRINCHMSTLSQSTIRAVDSYIVVVDHSKDVFSDTYRTIPQHRKTIEEICKSLDAMGKVCKNTSDAIPELKLLAPVKEFPLKLYRPFGELERSLESSREVLNSLDEKKYNDTLNAFNETRRSLEDANEIIVDMQKQTLYMISSITGFMVLIAALVFCHGVIMLCEGKKNLTDVHSPIEEK